MLHIEAERRKEQKREEKGYVRQDLRCRRCPSPGGRDRDVGAARGRGVLGTFASREAGRGEVHDR